MYLIICCIPQIAPYPIDTFPPCPAFMSIALSMHCRHQFATRALCASCPKSLQAMKGIFFERKCKGNSFQNLTNTKAYFGERKRGEGKQFCLLFEQGIHLDKTRERCTSLPLPAKWQLQGALKFLVNNFHDKYFFPPSLNSDIFPDCLFFVSCHFPQIKLIRDPHSTHY